ncbi:unnamed protein product [Mycena citricolor]|uniref:rRNA adenine N(6)-methyltransferase n=1 Tax=Mycena citricolor TaxID=2018698 RepID=A0AAD2HU67_9AGAR|nr:unnamed protein product [Mycena citricolor]
MLPRLFRQHARRKVPRNIYRAYSTKPGYDQSDESTSLPPLPLWRQYFPATSRAFQFRVCLANPKTAAHLAEAFVPAHSRDKIIIEAFPGPGTLTRALLALPRARIKRIIVLENADMYLKYLQPLEEVDDRIKVYPLSGELWSSYSAIEEMGVLQDVPIVPWDQGVHPQLQFVSHLTSNVAGEQLISQLLRNIPEKHWLFRYGRVPMSLLMNEYIWNRMLGTKASIRCKLSMIAAATSLSSMAVKADILKPYGDHFHPTNRASSVLKKDTKANLMRPGSPFVGINIVPNEEQVRALVNAELGDVESSVRSSSRV